MTDADDRRAEDLSARPTGELVKQLTDQLSTLVREELRLAQLEMAQKAKQAGKGAGLLGGAALLAALGAGALVACAIAALALVLPVWAAALVVAVVVLAVAGALALSGKKQLARAAPPTPRQAAESVKTDVETIKQRTRG